MQHGHFTAHEASHFDAEEVVCEASTLQASNTRVIVRATSRRAVFTRIVLAWFINYFFFSAASIFFTYLAGALLKSSRQPLQQSFTSRP